MILVLFACPGMPDKATAQKYADAAGAAAVRWIPIPGRSAAFSAEAQSLRRVDGRLLPGLLAKYARDVSPSQVWLACYSAGYGLVRELLAHPADAAAIDGIVAIDAVHTGFGQDHRPLPSQLKGFVAFARRAAEGWATFYLGHTDVQTPQTGPGAFASTTQVAEALAAEVPPAGRWVVRSYDLADDAHQMAEHGRALTVWGPDLLREALAAARAAQDEALPDTVPEPRPSAPARPVEPWQDPGLSLGARAVEWSLHELHAGAAEVPPGSNAGPHVAAYLAACERGGKPLGITQGAWCAASACCAAKASLLPGELMPHPYRASGLELAKDAVDAGTWRDVELARTRQWSPERGDLLIMGRGTKGGWQRHVCRVVSVDGDTIVTIGGNEGDRWALTERNLRSPELLGFVEYPRAEARPNAWLAELAGSLIQLSDSVMRGERPIGEVLELVDQAENRA
jgi:hypothetical protein